MNEKLIECPFCGGEATMDSSGKKYQVWCKRCSCIHMGEFYNTEAEAIAAWNRRAQPENEPLVRCGECEKYQSPHCAAKHEQALMDFCSHGVRKPERSEGE